jgi:hypothetical protein
VSKSIFIVPEYKPDSFETHVPRRSLLKDLKMPDCEPSDPSQELVKTMKNKTTNGKNLKFFNKTSLKNFI